MGQQGTFLAPGGSRRVADEGRVQQANRLVRFASFVDLELSECLDVSCIGGINGKAKLSGGKFQLGQEMRLGNDDAAFCVFQQLRSKLGSFNWR